MTVTNPFGINWLTPFHDPVKTTLCLIMVVIKEEIQSVFTGRLTPVSIQYAVAN